MGEQWSHQLPNFRRQLKQRSFGGAGTGEDADGSRKAAQCNLQRGAVEAGLLPERVPQLKLCGRETGLFEGCDAADDSDGKGSAMLMPEEEWRDVADKGVPVMRTASQDS